MTEAMKKFEVTALDFNGLTDEDLKPDEFISWAREPQKDEMFTLQSFKSGVRRGHHAPPFPRGRAPGRPEHAARPTCRCRDSTTPWHCHPPTRVVP